MRVKLAVLMIASVFGFAREALAITVSASANAFVNGGTAPHDGGNSITSAHAISTGAVGGSASAHATITGLKHLALRADTFASINGGPKAATAYAFAAVDDSFVLTLTDPFGTPLSPIAPNFPYGGGTFTCIIVSTGYALAGGGSPNDAAASAALGWSVTVGNQLSAGEYVVSTYGPTFGELPHPFALTLPWSFGEPIAVQLSAYADAVSSIARGDSGPHAIVNYSNSLYWGGIVSARDQLGNPVEHFTAFGSDGNTDWATAVPEPPTLILFLVGLVAMFSRQRATTS